MANLDFMDRAKGALLGLAIGDALGAPFDGMAPYDIYQKFGTPDGYYDSLGSKRTCGQYTANTQLALLIAACVATNTSKTPDWRNLFAGAHVKAIGNARDWDETTKNATDRFARTQKLDDCGEASTTGFFLPKAIPLGIWSAIKDVGDDGLVKGAASIASFSHKGMAQALALASIAMVVRDSLRRNIGGKDKLPNPYILYQDEDSLFARVIQMCRKHETDDQKSLAGRLDFARRKLQAQVSLKEFVGDNGNSCDVYEATPLSLFCFFKKYDDFGSISAAAARGGAASLNSCLVGGMVGSYAGTSFLADKKDMMDDLEESPRILALAEKLSMSLDV